MKPDKWEVGQHWLDAHKNEWRVVRIEADGLAFLEMLKPYHTRPCSQRPIPVDWTFSHYELR